MPLDSEYIPPNFFLYVFYCSMEEPVPFIKSKYEFLKSDMRLNSGWHKGWVQPIGVKQLHEPEHTGEYLQILVHYFERSEQDGYIDKKGDLYMNQAILPEMMLVCMPVRKYFTMEEIENETGGRVFNEGCIISHMINLRKDKFREEKRGRKSRHVTTKMTYVGETISEDADCTIKDDEVLIWEKDSERVVEVEETEVKNIRPQLRAEYVFRSATSQGLFKDRKISVYLKRFFSGLELQDHKDRKASDYLNFSNNFGGLLPTEEMKKKLADAHKMVKNADKSL